MNSESAIQNTIGIGTFAVNQVLAQQKKNATCYVRQHKVGQNA